MLKKALLITAGGKGLRMQSETPKQFIIINRKPVLLHSIEPFLKYTPDIEIVVVLPENLIDQWKELCKQCNFLYKHQIVPGGPTRFHSVKNGLKYVSDNCIVAIHDGVRPMVSHETIERSYTFAQRFGNAIPVFDINESVRWVDGIVNKVQDRSKLKIVQTPQVFRSEIIKEAYNQNFDESFTDDASVVESRGEKIFLVEGNRENIKITMPADIKIAKALLSK